MEKESAGRWQAAYPKAGDKAQLRASVTSGNESGGTGCEKQIVLKKEDGLEHVGAAFGTTVGPLVGDTPLVFCFDSNCRGGGRGRRAQRRGKG